ncbi:hypothetical protein TruAng_007524 [Truncatella angustata]|nr:hypothetical protein TruAng_007524 [Truncatella angustata]
MVSVRISKLLVGNAKHRGNLTVPAVESNAARRGVEQVALIWETQAAEIDSSSVHGDVKEELVTIASDVENRALVDLLGVKAMKRDT